MWANIKVKRKQFTIEISGITNIKKPNVEKIEKELAHLESNNENNDQVIFNINIIINRKLQ